MRTWDCKSSGSNPATLTRRTSTVAILAVRIRHGTTRPHSAKRSCSEISPGQPALAELVIMSTHASSICFGAGGAPITRAGRSRSRGASTNGIGTQTIEPAAIELSAAIESLAVSLARPFVEIVEVADKRITSRFGAGDNHVIAFDFPRDVVTGLQSQRNSHCPWDRSLCFCRDSTKDHVANVREFLTIRKTFTLASASVRKAPGSCRPCGSALARRRRPGAALPYRLRSD